MGRGSKRRRAPGCPSRAALEGKGARRPADTVSGPRGNAGGARGPAAPARRPGPPTPRRSTALAAPPYCHGPTFSLRKITRAASSPCLTSLSPNIRTAEYKNSYKKNPITRTQHITGKPPSRTFINNKGITSQYKMYFTLTQEWRGTSFSSAYNLTWGTGRGPTGPSLGAAAPVGGAHPGTRRCPDISCRMSSHPGIPGIALRPQRPAHGPWAMPSPPPRAPPSGRAHGRTPPGVLPYADGPGPTTPRGRGPSPAPTRQKVGAKTRPAARPRSAAVLPSSAAAMAHGVRSLPARGCEAGRRPGRASGEAERARGLEARPCVGALEHPDASPGPLGSGGWAYLLRDPMPVGASPARAGPRARASVGRETPTFL